MHPSLVYFIHFMKIDFTLSSKTFELNDIVCSKTLISFPYTGRYIEIVEICVVHTLLLRVYDYFFAFVFSS